MIKELTSPMKIGILSGIFSTLIFVYFLDPILTFFGKGLLAFFRILSSYYSDRLYSEIATGDMDYAFLFFTILFICPASISIGLTTLHIFNKIKKKTAGIMKQKKALFAIVWVTFALISLLMVVDGFIRKRISTSFHQHLTIITPYISLEERNKLLAEYANMSSENDYKKIAQKLESAAQTNGLTLPPNKLYLEK